MLVTIPSIRPEDAEVITSRMLTECTPHETLLLRHTEFILRLKRIQLFGNTLEFVRWSEFFTSQGPTNGPCMVASSGVSIHVCMVWRAGGEIGLYAISFFAMSTISL